MTEEPPSSVLARFRRAVFGAPRNVQDPGIFHKMSLVAFLAWVGLGADGLSSSAYGPDEAFRALGAAHVPRGLPRARDGAHGLHHLATPTAAIIEQFPHRRRRLRRRHQAARPARRRRLRLRAARRLRAHHHRLDRLRRRRRSSASCRPTLARAASCPSRSPVLVAPHRHEPARRQGVGDGADADLPGLPRHARRPDRRRRSPRTRGACPRSRTRSRRGFAHGARHARRSAALALALPARLLAGRRHLHRHRGGLERPADHARAARRRPASARWSTWRVSLAFTAGGILLCYLLLRRRSPSRGKTMNAVLAERVRRRVAPRRPRRRARLRRRSRCSRGRAALRRRAGRLHRRAARHGEHGGRLVAAAPLRLALRSAHHARTASC